LSTDPWHEVHRELALWEASGRKVRVWLRDDDAIRATPALRRLEALAVRHSIQIGLAVIPGLAEPEIVDYLHERRSVFHPMCHGWMHEMHEGIEVGEFGSSRAVHALRVDAVRALKRFQSLFGDHHPVFVPPFGRLNPTFLPELLRIGFAAVSNKPMLWQSRLSRLHAAFSWLPQGAPWLSPAPGLLDVHVDPVDWARSTALSEGRVAAQIVGELRLRRKGYIRTDAPIGILTHHLVHDEAIWTSLEQLLGVLCQNSAVAFQQAARLSTECVYAIHRQNTMADALEFHWRDAIPYD
jgi:hypothetical protein